MLLKSSYIKLFTVNWVIVIYYDKEAIDKVKIKSFKLDFTKITKTNYFIQK